MTFYNEDNNIIKLIDFETTEQALCYWHIEPTNKVLELGARYGFVSRVICIKTNNKNVVCVEPDYRVWDILEKNLYTNNFTPHIVKGTISRTPQMLYNIQTSGGYGTMTREVEKSFIPNYTLEEIETKYNIKFDALVADCEGFLGVFLKENPKLYDELNVIIFELDGDDKSIYDEIISNLKTHNFVCKLDVITHQVWKK